MKGTLYVVGVGPGDPELLTLKAVRVIRNADIIAFPSAGNGSGVARHIVEQAIPEMSQKEMLPLNFPMLKADLPEEQFAIAEKLQQKLQEGKNVVFLTLGDPGFYSTPYHFIRFLLKKGYPVEIVSGVSSFSAASARLQIPLAMGEESVLISAGEIRDFPGTQVILKVGSRLGSLSDNVRTDGKTVYLVENCGLKNEKVYSGIDSFPPETGYFSILIII